jgi:iron complex transport system ATP-binding protein
MWTCVLPTPGDQSTQGKSNAACGNGMRRVQPPPVNARPAILEIAGLCIRRGDVRILDNVSWRVQRGEHWAILGANGSGKTSLLSALTGYLTPTSGTITLLGSRYGRTDWRELRKRVGLVSSSIRQMMPDSEPAMETVVSGKYAMIDLWGRVTPADRKRARHLLRQIQCEHLAERPWGYLSQGERQRILIGRALMGRPHLLILDEPCAGLDPVAREHFLQFLQRLGRQRRSPTLVLVTHHVEEIAPVFSHTFILREGRAFAAGRTRATLTSMNLSQAFYARVRLNSDRGRFSLTVGRRAGGVV